MKIDERNKKGDEGRKGRKGKMKGHTAPGETVGHLAV